MKKSRIAFTLVELIVVITILAILWTIAFITLQWYSMDARDSKRVSDVRSLLNKINVENVKWVEYEKMLSATTFSWTTQIKENPLKINGEDKTWYQGIVNFSQLKEDGKSFKDPRDKVTDYPMAYAEWSVWVEPNTVSYKFVEMATINERKWQAVVMWNYYRMKPDDSPSLFINGDGDKVENWNNILPYNPWVTPWNPGGWNSSGGTPPSSEEACTFDAEWDNWKFDKCKFG